MIVEAIVYARIAFRRTFIGSFRAGYLNLDMALASGAGDPGFKSLRPRHAGIHAEVYEKMLL